MSFQVLHSPAVEILLTGGGLLLDTMDHSTGKRAAFNDNCYLKYNTSHV